MSSSRPFHRTTSTWRVYVELHITCTGKISQVATIYQSKGGCTFQAGVLDDKLYGLAHMFTIKPYPYRTHHFYMCSVEGIKVPMSLFLYNNVFNLALYRNV
jgi:hypothetical protein